MKHLASIAVLGLFLGLPVVAEPAEPLPRSARKWVRHTLAEMTLEQKAAQMVMVRAYGIYRNPRSDTYRELLTAVRDLGVGGVVIFDSDLESIPRLLNDLQDAAAVPLLVAADFERGLGFRVRRGPISFPHAMAIGATFSEDAARFVGEVTAREGRAVGVHWVFAPVADVNNNPANPIINVRSFGEDPELVARMALAFIAGARGAGMLTTVKHFPGHGDTAVDSHVALPTIEVDRERLEAVELVPFRRAVDAGVDAVMVGHVAIPALDPSGTPATLSPVLTAGLLRDEMGFEGLIVTDAIEMKGLEPAWTGGATVRAVQAGADVVLLPADTRVAIQSLVRAVAEGQLTEERLDASVRLILETKARLGLHRDRRVDPGALGRDVARPEDLERAAEIARASITVVRNHGDVLPLAAETPLRLLQLVVSGSARHDAAGLPADELRARRVAMEIRALGPEVSAETADEIVAAASEFSHVVVSALVRVAAGDGGAAGALSPSQVRLLERLHGAGTPMIVLSFGSPYLLAHLPEVPVYVCAYSWASASRRAAVAALFGEVDVGGRLPVTLPGLYPYGHGLEIPRREMTLRASENEAGFRPGGMKEVDRVIDEFLEQGAFPGGVVAVGHRGALVHLRPFGKLSQDEGAAVAADTIYDLASLTKVVATTTMAMILVAEGRLELDSPVQDFLPLFTGEGKEKVTVRHLLTHSSGVDWWAPLYEDTAGQDAYVERIQAMDLVYEPGTDTKYSDLGLILLGEILERVAGQPLDAFVRERVFAPLGMSDTMYRPGPELIERIAPTENDPWRGRMVRGEVHDENALALGGVAPHAGLFSTAPDLARFAQMMVNGGVFEHRRIVSRDTVELFTRRAGVADSSRALGWDTKSPEKSSAGSLFSADSYGHTGFTGTSIWIDPQRQLFLILLTNRVHPTRENILIRQVRPAVADAVVRALGEPAATEPVVEVGLERLEAGAAANLAGQRLGLVVHAASLTADGRHAVDVLRSRGLDVVRLFTPEHGLRGRAAAGEAVAGGRDPESGLPVVSLYGEHRAPRPQDLEGLDALVFDLQGAGVRFYTYVSTLILCLEAAADAGIDFVVLDRPNPLGGERVEGPVAAREVVPASFVNRAPGPLVHGLTMGEMARFVNAGLETPARLSVVAMSGWRREMTWADTGRPWVAPSPNLRSAAAALAYPGVALLEATNVSEGRGTEEPFLFLGAPWLDPSRLRISVPGFELSATRFTPRGSPAAPRPKYVDRECAGLEVKVTDAAAAEPYRLGLELITAVARQDGFEWRRGGEALTWLLGTPRVYRDLAAGKTVAEILAADEADHAAWREARRPALLY